LYFTPRVKGPHTRRTWNSGLKLAFEDTSQISGLSVGCKVILAKKTHGFGRAKWKEGVQSVVSNGRLMGFWECTFLHQKLTCGNCLELRTLT
jgi:hypothetical protein